MENISGSKDDFEKKKKKDKSDISTTSNRPKTERKNVGAIPIPDANGTGENGENPDEGYLQSNIISHFYMGQKVRAMHGDRWYDARVVEIRQSKTNDITAILKKGNNPDALSPELKDELLKLAKKMECFVHYLGWNSRYDEWINLTKLKVSEKDQQSSRNLIKENLKTVTDMKIALAEYSEDGPTIEKILESIRDIKEKEKEEPVTAEPPQIQSPPQQPSSLSTPVPPNVPINIPLPVPIPLPIPIQSPPTTSQIVVNTIEKKSVVASPLPPTIERPASLSPQATGFGSPTRVAAMLSAAAAATSSTEVTVRDVAAMAVGLEARQRGGRVLIGPASNRNQKTLLHQVSSEAGLQALRSSYVPVTTTATYVAAIESTSKDEAQKDIQKEVEKKIEEKPIEEIQKEDKIEEEKEEKTIEAVIVKQPETPPKKEGTPEKSEELRKSARKSTIASSTASINAQKAALLMQSGPLTFPTPEKEKEKEKTPQPAFIDTPIVARKLSNTVTPTTTTPFADPTLLPSTSKGVPNKRKRSGRGGFGGSGIDRKSHGKNKNEDDSDEEDLGGGEASHSTPTISHRADTFHSLKTKMHKLMEQNNELNDLSLLDLPDYDQLLKNTRDEDLSDILEARCFELREIYMTAKSDIVAMEKKKRRFYEKKREKEKKMRERRSMTPMIASTSNTISDL
ncbi:unnamed protein product [Caenorhabditis angaria]|uniref:Tudor-knot domain-containing protein n=1 Tax=Caenorhabditis angaria TaxID=860376 RepID=A0A9P1IUL0_9PELO|nr:unnamed protein product [Caenorhabditis angaria]